MVNNSDLTPEFALAAACCRWPADTRMIQAVAQESQSATDWQLLIRIAARHRISGLVGHGLRTAGISVPGETAARLGRAEARIALANLRSAAETHRIVHALAAKGVDALAVKGVTLNALAFGGMTLKESRDIDLLIAPRDYPVASRMLAGDGYRRLTPVPELGEAEAVAWLERCKESNWHRAHDNQIVELHIALADNRDMIAGIGLDSPRQLVALGGGMTVETLADAELLAYLFVHGATHGWARLKWLADVNALLATRGPDAIEAAYRKAVARGAGRSAAQGLLLCERLLGLRLGESLSAELAADRRTRYMVRVAMDLIAGRFVDTEIEDSRFGTVGLHLSHFFLQPGLKPKLGVLAQKLRTPFSALEVERPGLLRQALSVPIWLWRRAWMKHKAGPG